jgi:hypothetical protein
MSNLIDVTPTEVAGRFCPEDKDGRRIHLFLTSLSAESLYRAIRYSEPEGFSPAVHSSLLMIENVLKQLLELNDLKEAGE